ncbi:hypothetical protein B7453_00380 [Pseudomonas sp. IB20]|uniref:hypothetical protein n=1 Tax=Pseudomonas TaxID=286 RepID=UPI000BA044FE|nr:MULTISPECIES: hypothetical protein [unclassified Pseudomonas]MCV2225575.1 hypothetical protein [Pseudomonas sp. AU10]OZO06486.1 hypothetical protein B7453_00380 [Pseudomonas sp. IB20]
MDFISLSEALDSMAKCAMREPEKTSSAEGAEWYSDAAYAEAVRYSEAASTLHMHLHNSGAAYPKWLEIDEVTSKPLLSDGVATEGMAMLRHMAGWRARLSDEHLRYMTECELAETAGIDPSNIRPTHRMGSGKYARQGVMRARRIGFNRAELTSFLTANNAVRRQDNIKPTHGHKTAAQRKLILEAIEELNFDAQALPPKGNGLSGIKKVVLQRLEERKHQEFRAVTAFNSAWKALRRDKKIRFAGQ